MAEGNREERRGGPARLDGAVSRLGRFGLHGRSLPPRIRGKTAGGFLGAAGAIVLVAVISAVALTPGAGPASTASTASTASPTPAGTSLVGLATPELPGPTYVSGSGAVDTGILGLEMTPWPSIPAPTPSPAVTLPPTPTPPPGTIPTADVLIPCGGTDVGNLRVTDGAVIVVACPDYRRGSNMIMVDGASGRVLHVYQAPVSLRSPLSWPVAIASGLWVNAWPGGACVGVCPPEPAARIDIATGAVTMLPTYNILGGGLGYVWAAAPAGGALLRYDPATMASVTIPFPYTAGSFRAACGSIWSSDASGWHRLDPLTGAVRTSIPLVADLKDLTDIGGECWAVAVSYRQAGNGTYTSRFVHFGRDGLDFASAPVEDSGPFETPLSIAGSAFWSATGAGSWNVAQQIDPGSGALLGTRWVTSYRWSLTLVGGRYWVVDSLSPSVPLLRLSIPVAPLASAVPPPGPASSPSQLPSASAAPSAGTSPASTATSSGGPSTQP
jgi:hypothetical protein